MFYDEGNPYMILDAKFKPGWIEAAKNGHLEGTLLNDYDKCIRDMISINAQNCGVIFPTFEQVENYDNHFTVGANEFNYAHSISKYNERDKFYTFPIKIPVKNSCKPEMSFIEWKTAFEKYTRDAIDKMLLIIKNMNNNK